mmetsp:Transcript_142/g.481  ORF Transcript_142/g.481 Transcript_142/m.481 type:complete len:246 (+) Transcript_142:40-777(+)
MRLNADLIARSPAYLNALKDRELDLRGNKISAIENLAACQNQFDSIDLSDNEIRKLECMAVLPRLKMLLLAHNRISRLAERLSEAFPGLETLVLTDNSFAQLSELSPLAGLPSLTSLSLVDNPVTKQQGYRHYVIARLPKLRVLDFKRVTTSERAAAAAAFGHVAAEAATGDSGDADGAAAAAGPTPEQIAQIKEAIASATSLTEVATLEKALKAGNYKLIAQHLATRAAAAPAEAAGGAEPMET